MTREELKKNWDAILAYKDGKPIQFRSGDDSPWKDVDNPMFIGSYQYRVKPEPREWWVEVTPSGMIWSGCYHHDDYQTIKVREVLD